MFIMSLALADLTVGAIVMPITSAYAITGNFLDTQSILFYNLYLHYLPSITRSILQNLQRI